MSIIAWLVVGIVTGLTFNKLEDQPVGRGLVHPVLGVCAALVGGLAYHMFAGLGSVFHAGSLLAAGGSAILVLWGFQWTQSRRIV